MQTSGGDTDIRDRSGTVSKVDSAPLPVPFFNLTRAYERDRRDILAIADEVLSGHSLIMGPKLKAFEREFAAFCGANHAIGVGNGLDALSLIVRGLGIADGDEVIVPGHTFIATWLAVTAAGATPVAADVEADSFNIDPVKVRHAITNRTRAVIAVHLYGRLADMRELRQLCTDHGLFLIEDAAQAHGASLDGQVAGSLGDAAAFSFYPTKNLGCAGDGGAIVTDNDDLAATVRLLRNYGSEAKYMHEMLGVNSRLDELQAAILSHRLRSLKANNDRRREIAKRYQDGLGGIAGITLPQDTSGSSVWHLFVIKTAHRDALRAQLANRGIGTLVHYPTPPHQQPAYSGRSFAAMELAVSEELAGKVLSLPMWPELTDAEIERVISMVKDALIELTP